MCVKLVLLYRSFHSPYSFLHRHGIVQWNIRQLGHAIHIVAPLDGPFHIFDNDVDRNAVAVSVRSHVGDVLLTINYIVQVNQFAIQFFNVRSGFFWKAFCGSDTIIIGSHIVSGVQIPDDFRSWWWCQTYRWSHLRRSSVVGMLKIHLENVMGDSVTNTEHTLVVQQAPFTEHDPWPATS